MCERADDGIDAEAEQHSGEGEGGRVEGWVAEGQRRGRGRHGVVGGGVEGGDGRGSAAVCRLGFKVLVYERSIPRRCFD